ncbi:MAG: hypothetical protein WDA00_00810 [Eubacteriales bacterium]
MSPYLCTLKGQNRRGFWLMSALLAALALSAVGLMLNFGSRPLMRGLLFVLLGLSLWMATRGYLISYLYAIEVLDGQLFLLVRVRRGRRVSTRVQLRLDYLREVTECERGVQSVPKGKPKEGRYRNCCQDILPDRYQLLRFDDGYEEQLVSIQVHEAFVQVLTEQVERHREQAEP